MSYQFKNNLPSTLNAADWFSDTFLGTANQDQNNSLQLMNEANRFNEYMSNTSYQRAVKDMSAAGINPMVAFSGGASGASTPQSASGTPGKFNGGILGKELANMTNEFLGAVNGKWKDDALKVLSKFVP